MNDALTAAALAASSGLTAPLRGEESTTWLGSEDLSLNGKLPKTRKPYTITKQRERWSEEEHARFVEALRLHGRAWRKIEEHIGTKTAVQIRSHAQKFFNKLEKKKEAGEAVEKEEDLTIPPPRPKRKPAKPYSRKDAVTVPAAVGTSQLQFPPDMQAAPQQYMGSYATTPTGAAAAAAAAAQHLGGLMNGFCGHTCPSTVSDATVAAVTAAASAAAAAAAAAVVAAAGQEVQTHMQAHPPSCFPFFGMPPSALAQITPAHGVSALDQAALLSPATAAAAAKAAELDQFVFHHNQEGVVPAAPAPGTDPLDAGGMADGTCSDRGLVEATGTTDGTHISANAQTRGSDGDSACSRETDNQGEDPSHALDISWQSKLNLQALQQLQQHDMSSSLAAAAAVQAGGFDLSHCSWGLGRLEVAEAVATALQGLSPAQALALLSNPYYKAGLAAADRSGQQAALQVAAAAAVAGHAGGQPSTGVTRTRSGTAGDSDAVDAATDTVGRTKSRRTAPSVNSGSTGPPAGTKRLFASGSEECLLPVKKVARDLSDTGEEGEVMEVTPSSPSIQEKDLKAVSQPSNTNGNTSGSHESEGSKRRQGTAQAEGSNPTNGNSSGNGYSVKDSNTATNTGTNGNTNGNGNGYSCGNGTSAFSPVGHHHHHHSHQPPAGRRTNHTGGHHQQHGASGGTSRHQHRHHSSHPSHIAGGEGSNGGVGASGTGFAHGRDEGRSSSDMEGPTQQQLDLQQQRHLQREDDADDEVMVPVEAGDMQEQQQDSEQATQLQALMASLHGMCGNPLMLQQAYGAAAAAAATAQQIVPSSAHSNQQHARYQQDINGISAQQQIAALQQQIEHSSMQNPPASQGFAPWHSSSPDYGGSFLGNSLLQQLGQGSAAQQLRAAAGLVGLAGSLGPGNSASGDASTLLSTYAQLAAAAAQHQHQQHTHQHNHYHYHQQQQQQQKQANSASAAAAAAAVGLQQLQQGFRHSSSSNPSAGIGSFSGFSGLSGLEVLTRVASAGTLDADEGQAGGQRRSHTHLGRVLEEVHPGKRQSGML